MGDDPASQVYVRNKKRAAEKIGIKTKDITLPANTTQTELLQLIDELNDDVTVHAILVQMPLPTQLDENAVIERIDPKKDADGLHPENLGHLFMGQPKSLAMYSAWDHGLIRREYQIPVAGKNVVIIGRSNLVGRPLAALMINADATVTVAHSKTKELSSVASQARYFSRCNWAS